MNSGRRSRHLRLLILPLALLGVAAAVLLWPTDEPAPTSPGVNAALRVELESRPDTTDPASELAAQIQAMRAPDESPVFHYHVDGSVSADLGRQFMKMSVATVDANGRVHTSCVDADAALHDGCGAVASSGRER